MCLVFLFLKVNSINLNITNLVFLKFENIFLDTLENGNEDDSSSLKPLLPNVLLKQLTFFLVTLYGKSLIS